MIILYGTGRPETVRALALPVFAKECPWSWIDADKQPDLPKPAAGDVLVVMGSMQLKKLQGKDPETKLPRPYPANKGLESLRETPVLVETGGFVLCTYSPGVTMTDPKQEGLLKYDLQLAKRLALHGSIRPQIGKYKWLDAEGFAGLVDGYITRAEEEGQLGVAFDTETMGLFYQYEGKKIVTLQLTADEGEGYAIHLLKHVQTPAQRKIVVDAMRRLMTHPKIRIRAANGKYDMQWVFAEMGIDCTNFTMDIVLVGSLLNENRSNSLSWLVKEHTSMGGYDKPLEDKYDKGHMEDIPLDDLLPYAAGDGDGCLRVSNIQIEELTKKPGLARFYTNLLHPAARAFEKIEHRGVLIDQERYSELEGILEEEIAKAHAEALSLIPARLRAKHAGKLDLGKPALKHDFLFTPMGLNLTPLKWTAGGKDGLNKKPSTDAAAMRMYEEVPEAAAFMQAYSRWTTASKMLGTYVRGFLAHLRPDGRYHPSYMLFNGDLEGGDDEGGTVTGRLSCKGPAMQTLPKHPKKGHLNWPKLLRKCFIAPPGQLFWEADFSQGELRVVACIAEESKMLDAYKHDKDLHCMTGAGFMNMSYDEFIVLHKRIEAGDKTLDPELAARVKQFRQRAKSANFGLLYGMGAEGYRIYARDKFFVNMTLGEATVGRDSFFETYPDLVTYHTRCKNLAHRDKQITSRLGRIRHLPLIDSRDFGVRGGAERQAINFDPQSVLSDLNLLTMILLEERYQGEGLAMVGSTHDAIYGYVDEDRADELLKDVVDTMSNLPIKERFGWEPQLPFPGDIQAGPSWGELSKVSFKAQQAAA